jgi:hypothetical protein
MLRTGLSGTHRHRLACSDGSGVASLKDGPPRLRFSVVARRASAKRNSAGRPAQPPGRWQRRSPGRAGGRRGGGTGRLRAAEGSRPTVVIDLGERPILRLGRQGDVGRGGWVSDPAATHGVGGTRAWLTLPTTPHGGEPARRRGVRPSASASLRALRVTARRPGRALRVWDRTMRSGPLAACALMPEADQATARLSGWRGCRPI